MRKSACLTCYRQGVGMESTSRRLREMRERGIVKSYQKDGDQEVTYAVIAPYKKAAAKEKLK